MSDPKPPLPVGEGDVPDKVLEELLAAFSGDDTPVPTGAPTLAPTTAPALTTAEQRIDLDDPAIDALLGIEPVDKAPADPPSSTSEGEIITSVTPVTRADAVEADGDQLPADPITEPAIDAVVLDLAAGLSTSPGVTQHADSSGSDRDSGPDSGAGGGGGDAAIGTPDRAPIRKPIQIDGSDDPLIDAVYLDEEGADRLRGDSGRQTEASMERTTILIGDDELEGSAGGIPVATGPNSMDPRLRARRIAVKRAVGRRRLKWFVIGGVAVIVITAVLAVLGSSLFEVTTIHPSGVSANTKASYDAAVAQIEGHPILLVDTHKIESQLEKNPWISEARVSTDFPDSASIEIVERVPIATYQGADSRWRIIDVDGVVLTVIPGQPLEFMTISGPGAEAEAGGSAGNAFRHAAELVEALSPAARSRTEQVVVSDTGELSLQFADTIVVLGAPENLLDKLTWLEALLQDDRANNCKVINVTTRDPGCVPNS
ncbi:MAG: FtsQ-type POTRA domain-containing protein [Ilumatobacteraceae bacterium]